MHKKFLSSILIGTMCLSLVACNNTTQTTQETPIQSTATTTEDAQSIEDDTETISVVDTITTEEDSSEDDEIVDIDELSGIDSATANLGLDLLYQQYSLSNDAQNVVVSPISIQNAMFLALIGANGNTYDELWANTYLGVYGNDIETIGKGLQNSNVQIANSVFVREDGISEDDEVFKEYIKDADKYANATSQRIPFDSTGVSIVNQWVSDNTNEKIKEIVQEFSPDDMAMLVNTAYFNSNWKEKFTEQKDFTFTNRDGSTSTIDAMRSKSKDIVGFVDDDFDMVAKEYKDGYSFVAIMPHNVDIKDYIKECDRSIISDMAVHPEEYNNVYLTMPSFKLKYDCALIPAFEQMGVHDAFGNAADFSKMSSSADLYISDIRHSVYVDVNTEGTEAAASTSVTMTNKSIEMDTCDTVRLNKPFIYAIVNNTTGEIAFIGVIDNMDALQ